MGLAVLPARLKDELSIMENAIIDGKRFSDIPEIEKHAEWFDRFADSYEFTPDNALGILKCEVGKTFVNVLRDAGVYKDTAEGMESFLRFVDSVNNK